MFLPLLDHILAELGRRWTENNDVLSRMTAFNPRSESFLDICLLKPFAEHYLCDIESNDVERKPIGKVIQRIEAERKSEVKKLLQFVAVLEEFKIAFHELQKLAVIAVTIPASSASCECTFSCLRRVKTYLCNRMANDQLNDLAVLAVERSLANKIGLRCVVNMFDALHNNQRIQLH